MHRCRTKHHHFVAAALAAGAAITALIGCTTAGDLRLEPGRIIALAPGERIALPAGATLHYVGVRSDSRCPPAVQCVWAGEAEVVFQFTPPRPTPATTRVRAAPTRESPDDQPPAEVVLYTPRQPTSPMGDWQLQLVSLAFGPAPAATIRLHQRNTPR